MNQAELQDEVKILRGQVHCFNANRRRLRRLKELKQELENYQIRLPGGIIIISKDSHSGSGDQIRLQVIEDIEVCQAEIEATKHAVNRVERFLRAISFEDQQMVKELSKGKSYVEVSEEFNFTTDGLKKRISRLMAAYIRKCDKAGRAA